MVERASATLPGEGGNDSGELLVSGMTSKLQFFLNFSSVACTLYLFFNLHIYSFYLKIKEGSHGQTEPRLGRPISQAGELSSIFESRQMK